MLRSDAVIIGAGQAGLAMSQCLSERGIDHVVLERGRIAERWRSERWDSLRLLTPNWMTRLPGRAYGGPDPHGFMTMPQVAGFLGAYAALCTAPVRTGVTVLAVRAEDGGGYRVTTDQGAWMTSAVVIATGACDRALRPGFADALPRDVVQVTPQTYRRPDDLPPGGVLVVGAGASGVQLAEELHLSGRPVTLSVGRHLRLPRRHRGRDILEWLDRAGILDEPAEAVADLRRARSQPSFQLVGGTRSLDLGTLQAAGVRLVGRAVAADGATVALRDDLAETTAAAQAKLDRLLDRIDALAPPGEQPAPFAVTAPGPQRLDLRAQGIRSVVWAIGYRRAYPWLRVPVLDGDGEILHHGGVTPARGLYVLGLPLLRRRKSTFIDGVGADARALAAHLHATLMGDRSWSMPTAMTS